MLNGFAVIFVVVGIGYGAARLRLLGGHGVDVLARVVYFIATPALLFEMLATTPPEKIFSAEILVAGAAALVVGALGFAAARWLWGKDLQASVLSMLAGSYSNSTNLGVPIATFVLGGPQYVAPLVLFQTVVYQPFAIMLLSLGQPGERQPALAAGQGRKGLAGALRGFANPMLVGGAFGIVASVSQLPVPAFLDAALAMVGAMTAPSALLVFGMSFAAGAACDREEASKQELWLVVLLKSLVYPAVAYLLARYAFGLDAQAVRAATVLAALPTANMVYVLAVRHGRCTSLARDTSLVTALLSVPVVLAIVWLLG